MIAHKTTTWVLALMLAVGLGVQDMARGNGGPFVVKYPGGDPAAKGVLARLDPSLLPARETLLRVAKEDLKITFAPHDGTSRSGSLAPPLVTVSAEYTIENPSGEQVNADFGFPILRGIYMNRLSMLPRPDVWVTVQPAGVPGDVKPDSRTPRPFDALPAGRTRLQATIISNSAIYGIIRSRAREAIELGIASDRRLADLVDAVRQNPAAQPAGHRIPQVQHISYGKTASSGPSPAARAREALETYLVRQVKWNPRDAALLVEYASLDFGSASTHPFDAWHYWGLFGKDQELSRLASANLGPLAAIGEQKATQLFAQLASRFDQRAAAAYETIFQAWGGDVRQRSIDLGTGRVRPREWDIEQAGSDGKEAALAGPRHSPDPTVYARVDYLDPRAKISEQDKQSCKRVLENLPVVFSFSPMNLLYYQVSFPAGTTQVVTVAYRQYAYADTREPASYQLAYVVHPASLWDDFGPIRVTVWVPRGVQFQASTAMRESGKAWSDHAVAVNSTGFQSYEVALTQQREKTGELFVAVEKASWDRICRSAAEDAAAASQKGPADQ